MSLHFFLGQYKEQFLKSIISYLDVRKNNYLWFFVILFIRRYFSLICPFLFKTNIAASCCTYSGLYQKYYISHFTLPILLTSMIYPISVQYPLCLWLGDQRRGSLSYLVTQGWIPFQKIIGLCFNSFLTNRKIVLNKLNT